MAPAMSIVRESLSRERWGHEKQICIDRWNTGSGRERDGGRPGLRRYPGTGTGTSRRRRNRSSRKAGAGSESEPSSSVARISLMHGDVSTQRGDSGDWATAALNQPMVSSDKISTGVNSRAEVQLDSANILRLGDNTLASIAGLSRNSDPGAARSRTDRLLGFQRDGSRG